MFNAELPPKQRYWLAEIPEGGIRDCTVSAAVTVRRFGLAVRR